MGHKLVQHLMILTQILQPFGALPKVKLLWKATIWTPKNWKSIIPATLIWNDMYPLIYLMNRCV